MSNERKETQFRISDSEHLINNKIFTFLGGHTLKESQDGLKQSVDETLCTLRNSIFTTREPVLQEYLDVLENLSNLLHGDGVPLNINAATVAVKEKIQALIEKGNELYELQNERSFREKNCDPRNCVSYLLAALWMPPLLLIAGMGVPMIWLGVTHGMSVGSISGGAACILAPLVLAMAVFVEHRMTLARRDYSRSLSLFLTGLSRYEQVADHHIVVQIDALEKDSRNMLLVDQVEREMTNGLI